MPRGGARPGAGRPKGSKDSKPRRISVRTLEDVERVKAQCVNEGRILPLALFMDVLNDVEKDLPLRLEVAKAAAPYLHPRLEAIAFQGQVTHKSHEEALAELDALAFGADSPKTIDHDPPLPQTEQPRKEPPGVTGGTKDQGEAA